MRFEWDENKNEANKRKHGISFETAIRAFYDPNRYQYIERVLEGQERWMTMGFAGETALMLLTVVHLYREEGIELVVRIISARHSTRSERKRYEENL